MAVYDLSEASSAYLEIFNTRSFRRDWHHGDVRNVTNKKMRGVYDLHATLQVNACYTRPDVRKLTWFWGVDRLCLAMEVRETPCLLAHSCSLGFKTPNHGGFSSSSHTPKDPFFVEIRCPDLEGRSVPFPPLANVYAFFF
ncbi:hypothetical protein VNO77_04517 [Canavalia gladiata]|uniref:Uncharacterized protein n=1 Tax=Canavalia gladiata TaxID=3824 RepID=A0AAN9R7U2_CANGL